MSKFEPSYDPIITARSLINSISNITFPIKIEKIALSHGIHEIIPRETKGYEGILISEGGKGIISYNQNIREPSRKRFTITHELGHFLITSHNNKVYNCSFNDLSDFSYKNKNMENEANMFAAELLMPEDHFKNDISLKEPSKRLFEKLTEKYGSSLTSTFIRYKKLTDEKVAVILSENNHVKWGFGTNNFKFYMEKGSMLPKNSFAIDFFEGGSLPEDIEQVYNNAWFDFSEFEYEIEVYELSMPLWHYNQVLTMLWVSDKDYEIDEYEKEEGKELDGYLTRFK